MQPIRTFGLDEVPKAQNMIRDSSVGGLVQGHVAQDLRLDDPSHGQAHRASKTINVQGRKGHAKVGRRHPKRCADIVEHLLRQVRDLLIAVRAERLNALLVIVPSRKKVDALEIGPFDLAFCRERMLGRAPHYPR